MSLNEHDDSLENVTTVKQVARVFRDLTAQLRAEAAEVPRATDLLYISITGVNCSCLHSPVAEQAWLLAVRVADII